MVGGGSPVEDLIKAYSDKEAENCYVGEYARYWHGYLVFLRPLLLFFHYGSIRYLLAFIQLGLFVLLLLKLSRKDCKLVFPVFLFWIFLNPVTTMLSLQFNSVLVLTFLACLVLLYADAYVEKHVDDWYKWGIFFMLVGIITNYFDFLTYPLITLGIPLALSLYIFTSSSLWKNLCRILTGIALWFTGYAGMWFSKWVLGTMITKRNVIMDAYNSIMVRTSTHYNDISIQYRDILNVQSEAARNFTWKISLFILVLYLLYKIIRFHIFKPEYLLYCILIAVLPFGWYFVLKNHSFVHAFFTYRELAVSLFSVACLCMEYPTKKSCEGGGVLNP